ncbi:MAG: hypothetical protein J5912_09535, partial [Clostridia bacterium]|nr:hypothetical protein [Clostridia bacterium]
MAKPGKPKDGFERRIRQYVKTCYSIAFNEREIARLKGDLEVAHEEMVDLLVAKNQLGDELLDFARKEISSGRSVTITEKDGQKVEHIKCGSYVILFTKGSGIPDDATVQPFYLLDA